MADICKNKTMSVDMNLLVRSMTHDLEYYWSLGEDLENETTPCVIYKVQQHIRMVDKLCYEPCILSIGPYHHGTPALRTMQKEKWSYLDYVLKLNCAKTILDYLQALEGLAKLARNCYSEEIELDGEEFLQMLVLDGCFILVALGGTKGILARSEQVPVDSLEPEGALPEIEQQNKPHTEDSNDVKTSEEQTVSQEGSQDGNHGETKRTEYDNEIGQWFARFFNHDLFLLENQIPFFIVNKIFEIVAGDSTWADAPFTQEIEKYVESSLWWFPKSVQESDRPKDFHHLLHLCHMYFRPSQKAEEINHLAGPQYFNRFLNFGRKYLKIGLHPDETEECSSLNSGIPCLQDVQHLNRWRRASQYLEAGVKFKKRLPDKFHPHSILDIKFSNGAMEIPFIVIDEHTGTLFRNLIAFEQTCPQFGDDFTSYIVFLSQLISMPEDVTLLARREIIVHHLESDEMVSDLFTMLSKDVVFDFNGQYYLKSLCQIMEEYYQSRLNRWIAWLWLNHFSNPWMGLAAFATVIVLICTIVQTVFGILAYTNPPG